MSLLARHAEPIAEYAPPAPAEPAPPAIVEEQIPTVVSAAWELELIIAGAVTFALFQLPGSLDALRVWAEPRVTGGVTTVLFMVYLYAKVIVYALIGAFLLNLTSRAYWVGLVGLHSVFPHGVKWHDMKMGPVAVESYRKRIASLPTVIARVDNFASVIFSFAFLIVVVCVYSLVAMGVFGAIAWVVTTAFFHGHHALAVVEVLAFGFAIPAATVGLIDKRYGARWAPTSRAGRALRRAMSVVTRLNGTALFGPIFLTLLTNLGRGRMLTLFYSGFLGAMLVSMAELVLRLGILAPGAPRYVPDDDRVAGVYAQHYESMRSTAEPSNAPTIQSDVVDGPYVRLFVPYVPERHDAAIARSCPGARPLRASSIHASAPPAPDRATAARLADTVLACLTRLHAVTLDGAPVPDLHFRFYTQPATGQRGMIAYLPTAPLASGMHTLSVMPAPRAPESASTKPVVPNEIVFWK